MGYPASGFILKSGGSSKKALDYEKLTLRMTNYLQKHPKADLSERIKCEYLELLKKLSEARRYKLIKRLVDK